jgi:hypothetical protein
MDLIHILADYGGSNGNIGADWLTRRCRALRRVAPRCPESLTLQTKSMVEQLPNSCLLLDHVAAL